VVGNCALGKIKTEENGLEAKISKEIIAPQGKEMSPNLKNGTKEANGFGIRKDRVARTG